MENMNGGGWLSEMTSPDTAPESALSWPPEPGPVVLVMTTGERAPERIDFGTRHVLTLGRGNSADVCVLDPAVSPLHLRLRKETEGIRVIDLGSRNGTWIRGLRVSEALLAVGDCVLIGNTTLLNPMPSASDRPRTADQECGAASRLALEALLGESARNVNLRASLREFEAKLIHEALRLTCGNQRRAAAWLGLPLRTFERKLRNINLRQRARARASS